MAQAGHGGNEWIGAVGEDDVVGRVAHAVDLDDTRSRQPAAAAQQINVMISQPPLLSGVGIVRHHEIPPSEDGLDVHFCRRDRLPRSMHCFTGSQEGFRRDACPIRALTPHELPFHNGDPKATFGQSACAVFSR